jgi:hypothetical protein
MEILGYLWNFAPLWGPLVVVAAIVYAVLRARRLRSASGAEQPAKAPAPEAESDVLDSSHIGFAPLVGVLEPPHYDSGAVAGGDAKQK